MASLASDASLRLMRETGVPWWLAEEAAASTALDRDETCGTYVLGVDGVLREPDDGA